MIRGFALALGVRRARGARPTGGRRWNAVPTAGSDKSVASPNGHAGRVTMRSQQVATLPWFRAGGGYSVPLFAARSRHEKPYPPMSKINLAFPFSVPFKGNAGKYTPFPRPTQAGIWEIEVLLTGEGRVREGDQRPETRGDIETLAAA